MPLLTDLSCTTSWLRSVTESLRGQLMPPAGTLVSVVSQSREIREGARLMLIAVGLAPDALCEIDPAEPGWLQRIVSNSIVVADVVTAKQLPPACPARVFRVIADASLDELRQLCGRHCDS